MKTKKQKRIAFTKAMKKLTSEEQLKEDKNSFFEVLKRALKPQPTSR